MCVSVCLRVCLCVRGWGEGVGRGADFKKSERPNVERCQRKKVPADLKPFNFILNAKHPEGPAKRTHRSVRVGDWH